MTSRHLRPAAILAVPLALALGAQSAQAQRACRVAEVVVSPDTGRTMVGSNFPFVATAYSAAGSPCDDAVFTWVSGNQAIAVVDENGIAVGISVGQTTITARTGRGTAVRSGRARIEVSPAGGAITSQAADPGISAGVARPIDRQPEGSGVADQIHIAPLRVSLVRGERKMIEEIRAVRADGQNAARVPVTFSVDPGGERIISVDSFGIITSLGDTGTANVRAAVPGSSRIQPRVVRVEVRGDAIQFPRPVISLPPGTVESLSIFVPSQGRAVDHRGLFSFRSSDTTRVKVNLIHPYVEAVAPGTATVSATSSFYPDINVTVNVHRRVESMRLTPADSQIIIAIGGRHTVRVDALAADGSPVPEAPLTWRHPDSTIASLSGTGNQRVITGTRMGNAIITLNAPGAGDRAIERSIRVRVVAGGLAVAQPRVALPVGQRRAIEATILGDNRQSVGPANEYLQWSSSADSVARVESNQIVALRPGTARLTGRAIWDSTVTVQVTVVGDLIVAAQQGGRWDLMTLWENGSRRMPLTSDTLVEAYPAWSPDLTRIAYTSANPAARSPTSGLWVMGLDGSPPVRLTDDTAQVGFPRWLGNRIYFDWSRGGRTQIWVHELGEGGAAGTNRQITTLTPGAPNQAPAISPDGTRLVYVSRRETSPGRQANVILSAALDGTDERVVVTSQTQVDAPLFSPDGSTLYFLRAEPRGQMRRVARQSLTGSDSATAVTPATMFVQSYSMSGDGQSLALHILETAAGGQTPRVVMFRIATGEVTAVGGPDDRFARPALRPAVRP